MTVRGIVKSKSRDGEIQTHGLLHPKQDQHLSSTIPASQVIDKYSLSLATLIPVNPCSSLKHVSPICLWGRILQKIVISFHIWIITD